MTDYQLTLAQAETPGDCIAEPFLQLVRLPSWVAYLTFERRYLEDVNDDPDMEDEYGVGLTLWVERVQQLHSTLCRQFGGTPVQISVFSQGRMKRLVDMLTRSVDQELTVQAVNTIDPEILYRMTTYGGEATMWTSLPGEARSYGLGESMPALGELIRERALPWWISHGYKEPFLAGDTRMLTVTAMARLIQTEVGIPVEVADEAFVPHRVQMHRRFTSRGG